MPLRAGAHCTSATVPVMGRSSPPLTDADQASRRPCSAVRRPPSRRNQLSWTGFEPSRSHTHTSVSPDRPDWKTKYLPSGDVRASASPRLEEISFVAGPAGFAGLANLSCQMLLGWRTWA